MKNIVLIGMRGSGKTTIAKLLAERLGWQVIELDAEIEKKTGMSIKEMVAQHGWDYFRDRESEVVKEAATLENVVISTGGGVVLRPENVTALKQNGICIYLKAPAEVLIQRIGGEASQLPRLTESVSMAEEMKKVLEVREPLYAAAAEKIVDVAHLGPDAVARTIEKMIYGG